VVTDAGKVQQVLYNFLSNAVKFTPLRGRIDVQASMVDDKTVRIAISDTGCGIAKEDQELIFDQFRQADGSLTREAPGSGLGLAISKELASMLAGSIGLQSEVGAGSTFWLDLPVTLRPAETDAKRPEVQQPFGLGSRLGRAPTGETEPAETRTQPSPEPKPALPLSRIEDLRPRRTTPVPLQPEIANPEVKD